jgi:hypothetical protein
MWATTQVAFGTVAEMANCCLILTMTLHTEDTICAVNAEPDFTTHKHFLMCHYKGQIIVRFVQ